MLTQTGPGGNVHIDNEGAAPHSCLSTTLSAPPLLTIAEAPCFLAWLSALSGGGLLSADFVGDKVGGCGQLDINGNRFVDPKQRPQDYDDYNDILVNLTAAANDLLPAGAPKHAVLRYTDNYASTGDNDSTLFADSWVTSRDGIQQVYSNCTKPGGPIRVQMKVFFADGISSYSKILDEYFALSFKMGATGIFHDVRRQQYRCRLGCILLKTAAILLLTGVPSQCIRVHLPPPSPVG